MKGLKTLKRLEKWAVDEAQRAVAALNREADALAHRRAAFEAELARERDAEATTPLATLTAAAYAARALDRRDTFARTEAALAADLAAASDRLSDAFAELKKVETVERRHGDDERLADGRRQQSVENEIALGIFRSADD